MLPKKAMLDLRRASFSAKASQRQFKCGFLSPDSNSFVETWAPKCYAFLLEALGPFQVEPLEEIELLTDGFHSAGATASFEMNGRICLSTSVDGSPGVILEKLTHEMTHASLASFPEGDPFYEEGFVDYSVWTMAHAPYWGSYQKAMLTSAAHNIEMRRKRALLDQNDYDRKRWAGGLFASLARGPFIISTLREKKMSGDLTW